MEISKKLLTAEKSTINDITEFGIEWAIDDIQQAGSTHELVINNRFVFVTGQNMHQVAKFDMDAEKFEYYNMPKGSGPHGIVIDKKGQLWVSLEFHGQVVRLNETGKIIQTIDVNIYPNGNLAKPINTAPHGLGLDADGETIWFTGKRTNTVGKISANGQVEHFQLNTLAALPVFLYASKNQGMWGTELLGNSILNISLEGKVQEYVIPTTGSRPIAVISDPIEDCMWFTQEAGVKIGKIDATGNITEYPVPTVQHNDILASLCFDNEMNLWVQVYIDGDSKPEGSDYIIKLDRSIRDVCGKSLTGVPYTTHIVPSRKVIMHRIRKDLDGNLWFTELKTDKLGKINLK